MSIDIIQDHNKIDQEYVEQYDKLIRHILKTVCHVSWDKEDDYAADVYKRLLINPSYNPERGPYTTWLGYVVRSVVSNNRRKEARSQDALDHSMDLDAANNVIGAEDAGTAEDELQRIFNAAKGKVSERDLEIVWGSHVDNIPRSELAKKYGLSVDGIGSVLTRTMKVLREQAAS